MKLLEWLYPPWPDKPTLMDWVKVAVSYTVATAALSGMVLLVLQLSGVIEPIDTWFSGAEP